VQHPPVLTAEQEQFSRDALQELLWEDAGLVRTEKVGRSRQCRLGEERLDDAMAWISFYQRLWERRLDGLEAYFTLQRGTDR